MANDKKTYSVNTTHAALQAQLELLRVILRRLEADNGRHPKPDGRPPGRGSTR